jgi:hypothetical protein
MEAATPRDVLMIYSQKFIDALHKSLEKNERFASGLLWQSIKAPVKIMGQKVVMEITMNDYWKYVNDGRKAGSKQPPQDAMLKHIANRGIGYVDMQNYYKNKKGLKVKRKTPLSKDKALKTLSFLIGRKIKQKGIKPTHFADEVIESSLRLEMEKELSKSVGRLIKVEISNVVKNGNNNK